MARTQAPACTPAFTLLPLLCCVYCHAKYSQPDISIGGRKSTAQHARNVLWSTPIYSADTDNTTAALRSAVHILRAAHDGVQISNLGGWQSDAQLLNLVWVRQVLGSHFSRNSSGNAALDLLQPF